MKLLQNQNSPDPGQEQYAASSSNIMIACTSHLRPSRAAKNIPH